MLKQLKFVQGAVAKKDLLPAMTHFRIEDGTVRSYNGRMAISSPINLDIACCPKAEPMVKAIGNCDESVRMTLTTGGRLSIRSGKSTWFVPTIEGETPHVMPEGDHVEFNGAAFLDACKALWPFVGNDASRQWARGILLNEHSAFATNNTCLVEYWLGVRMPFVVNVPREAIKEIVRIDEPPTHAQLDSTSMTFHYTDGRWIRTQLLDTTWPDLTKILDKPSSPVPVPPDLFDGLAVLRSSVDGASRVYMVDGKLRTSLEEGTGAVYDLGHEQTGCYNVAMLELLRDVVTQIDMGQYPGPALFFGDKIRGAITGYRM